MTRISEYEDIVMTEEQERNVRFQREPTGLDPEYLSNEEIDRLILLESILQKEKC